MRQITVRGKIRNLTKTSHTKQGIEETFDSQWHRVHAGCMAEQGGGVVSWQRSFGMKLMSVGILANSSLLLAQMIHTINAVSFNCVEVCHHFMSKTYSIMFKCLKKYQIYLFVYFLFIGFTLLPQWKAISDISFQICPYLSLSLPTR